MSNYYQGPTDDHFGYWRGLNPSPTDIDQMLQKSGNRRRYQVIIHGEPCHESGEWALRHPGEAQAGQATYPYSLNYTEIVYAAQIARVYIETGFEDEYEDVLAPGATFATNFANVLIGATDEDCWASVEWIDFVDI